MVSTVGTLRRGGDSNPRYPLTKYGSLANCWFKPLTHLSSKNDPLFGKRAANIAGLGNVLATPAGIEPATICLEGRCSIR